MRPGINVVRNARKGPIASATGLVDHVTGSVLEPLKGLGREVDKGFARALNPERGLTRGDLVDQLVAEYGVKGKDAAIQLFGQMIEKHGISQHAVKTMIVEFRQRTGIPMGGDGSVKPNPKSPWTKSLTLKKPMTFYADRMNDMTSRTEQPGDKVQVSFSRGIGMWTAYYFTREYTLSKVGHTDEGPEFFKNWPKDWTSQVENPGGEVVNPEAGGRTVRTMNNNPQGVIEDGLYLCDDCVQAIANDDYSGLDYHYSEKEAEKRKNEIKEGIHSYAPGYLVVGEEIGFSSRSCSVCGTRLHGNRHEGAVLGEVAKQNPEAGGMKTYHEIGYYTHADGKSQYRVVRNIYGMTDRDAWAAAQDEAKRLGHPVVLVGGGSPITVTARRNNPDTDVNIFQQKPKERGGSQRVSRGSHPAKGNPEADSHAARELELYVDNDSALYRSQKQPIEKNLITKMATGKYNHADAVKLWGYLMESGAKKYVKEHGSAGDQWHEMFNTATRKMAAEEFANHFETEAALGNYDNFLPKKYSGWSGKQWKRNSRGNPATESAEGFEKFHGFPSREIVEVEEEEHYHSNLWAVGDLLGFKVRGLTGKDYSLEFDGVMLSCNKSRTHLYIIGGDQELNLSQLGLKDFDDKESVIVGECWCVAYSAEKSFDDYQPTDYVHGFGPEEYQAKLREGADLWDDAEPPNEKVFGTGDLPTLRYDAMNERLYLDGGTYKIDDPMVGVSAGIVD